MMALVSMLTLAAFILSLSHFYARRIRWIIKMLFLLTEIIWRRSEKKTTITNAIKSNQPEFSKPIRPFDSTSSSAQTTEATGILGTVFFHSTLPQLLIVRLCQRASPASVQISGYYRCAEVPFAFSISRRFYLNRGDDE